MSSKEKIGDYIIERIIGEGKYGKVKLAIHSITKEKVAIKIMEKSKIKTKEDEERVEEEINCLKEINNINIVQFYEIIEDLKNYYLILEYISGGELFSYIIKNEKLDEQTSSFFLYQIINGIKAIHEKKICHRDLKPENILLDKNKKILKIIDFGLAKKYNGYLSTPCGSPSYVPPEIIKGLIYNSKLVDIWSSGIILYAMVFGCLPFDEQNDELLFKKILNGKIEFPNEDSTSNQCKDLIIKMLESEPEKRININDILNHPFLNYGKRKFCETQKVYNSFDDYLIINYMEKILNIDKKNNIYNNINNNKHNKITTTYKLLKNQIIQEEFELQTNKINEKIRKAFVIKYDKKNSKNITNSLSSNNSIMNELNDVIKDANSIQKDKKLINNINMNIISHEHYNDLDFDINKKKTQFNHFMNLIKKLDTNITIEILKSRTNTPKNKKEGCPNLSNINTNFNTKGNNSKLNSSHKDIKIHKIKNKKINKRKNKNNNINIFSYNTKQNLNSKIIERNQNSKRGKSNENTLNKTNNNFIKTLNTSRQSKNKKINKSNDLYENKRQLTENNVENNKTINKKIVQSLNFQTFNSLSSSKIKINKSSLVSKKKMNTYVIKNFINKNSKNCIKEKSPKEFLNRVNLTEELSPGKKENNPFSISFKNKLFNPTITTSRNRKKKTGTKTSFNEYERNSKKNNSSKLTPEKKINTNRYDDFTICSTKHSLIELCIGFKKFCKSKNFILIEKDKIKYTIFLIENKKITIDIYNKDGINMVKLTRKRDKYLENMIKQIIVEVVL